ncbi:hypothetical protein SMGD1_0099 [Sulfurimonas gotlandica GD1]|uniref:DUF4395 domain-containing protein n=1 Tax=Sulfurimonas gotlandica (strain DSM 19862 / JCM 16533 / GD1) TaxID=929558 RepID=H1FS80_SULGG|nr:DUF4395 domain-containing protein [Sulfurimonas gotlandica]EHP28626.1 hypothetical protein SMGD1_0099 [Sulfurimonas gotlandica GD1]
MSYSCPLNFESVDSYVARFVALMVSILLIAYMMTFNVVILYFLFFDFMMRLYCKKDYSPLFQISRFLKKAFRLKDEFTDGGAKRLAGYFGLFFILTLVASNNLDFYLFSIVVSFIFLSCALLEAFFSYCLGCKIYFLIKKIYPSFMN